MFDFRHGGSNQKLLMDKKRRSKRIIIGNNGVFETKVEKQLTCDCDCDEVFVKFLLDSRIKLAFFV
jgi:hypothetical protein